MIHSVRPPSFCLGLYDPLSESLEPLAYFGPPWTDSPQDVACARRVITRLSAVLASRRHVSLAVGLFSLPRRPTPERASYAS